jgi:hypothetical protein
MNGVAISAKEDVFAFFSACAIRVLVLYTHFNTSGIDKSVTEHFVSGSKTTNVEMTILL